VEYADAKEYDVEAGETAQEAGVKARIKQQLEELIEETKEDAKDLAKELKEEIEAGQIEIETEGRKIIIRIREKGSFKSGSHIMTDEYFNVMDDIRAVLIQKPGKIQIQGHTDNIPIRSSRYRSNWELSTSRAVSVAEALMNGDINPRRFEISGFADIQPLVDNSTRANRARNRRVEIVIRQGIKQDISKKDQDLLQEEGQDIMRNLDLDPEYLFDLRPEEVF